MMNRRFDLSTLVRLQRQRRGAAAGGRTGDGRLSEVSGFGSDPGGLRMLAYVPPGLPQGAPLVVALHGCTQTAAGYEEGSGWSAMADRLGFALLAPEQRRANNPSLCFNWFEPGDTARDAGEALSIRQMVDHMLQNHGIDPRRVFVTGLSAGGAMAAVLAATYPEVFAGAAVVAGLPYGAAAGIPEALSAMARPAVLAPALRGGVVRAASRHAGPWPRMAVWHGDADATVSPVNAGESVKQWLDLHGLDAAAPERAPTADGHERLVWRGADGGVRVESHRIAGLGHGVPLDVGEGEGCCGVAGPYLLDAGVSSTHGILDFWGIDGAGAGRRPAARPERAAPAAAPGARIGTPPGPAPGAPPAGAPRPAFPFGDPGAVIAKALRAAGLMGRP